MRRGGSRGTLRRNCLRFTGRRLRGHPCGHDSDGDATKRRHDQISFTVGRPSQVLRTSHPTADGLTVSRARSARFDRRRPAGALVRSEQRGGLSVSCARRLTRRAYGQQFFRQFVERLSSPRARSSRLASL
jgi:hypothetical protein